MQDGSDDQLRGFLAGPFSIQMGNNIDRVDLYVAPLKNSVFLRLDFLQGIWCTTRFSWEWRPHAQFWKNYLILLIMRSEIKDNSNMAMDAG
jgi:hypothetical protein